MAATFKLRDYQEAAVASVRTDWDDGHKAVLLTAATGTGKTEIFLAILAQELEAHPEARALILCHRRDLIRQAQQRLKLRFPKLGKRSGVVMGTEDEPDAQIVVSTVQTLVKADRLVDVLSYGPIDYLIRDEAHRAVTESDRKVAGVLRTVNPDLCHLGVTATPIRADGVGLIEAYSKESFHYGIKEAVEHKTLVPPRWLAISTGISVADLATYNGDFTNKGVASVYEADNCLDLVVESHTQFAEGRQAMAFTASVDGAHRLARKFQEAGYKAAAADGSTKPKDRAKILSDFRKGKLDILCNCMLYTEGIDVPSVSCIHQVRPTRSDGAYIQMIGRGLRTAPGKEDCLILDYAPEEVRNIVMLGDVLGVPVRKDVYLEQGAAPGQVIGGFTHDGRGTEWLIGDPSELLSRELDYLDSTPWVWYRDDSGLMSLGLGKGSDGIERTLMLVPVEEGYKLYGLGRPQPRSSWKARLIMESKDLDELMERADQSAASYGTAILTTRGKKWRKGEPSPAQWKYAYRLGITRDGQTKGELAQQISHQLARRVLVANSYL